MNVYCFKCRKKREIENPEPILLNNKRRAVRGKCSFCGTKAYTLIKDTEPALNEEIKSELPPLEYMPPPTHERRSKFEPPEPPAPPIHG